MATGQIVYIRRVANDTEAPNRIRELREARGLSQAELARQLHSDPSTLNKVELGKRGLDQEWMRRIARVLECAPADLLPISDNPYSLSEEERAVIEAMRSADERGRAILAGVAETVRPFGHRKSEEAA